MASSKLRSLLVALGAAALVAGAAGIAQADPDDWHHGHWHEREWRDWCWHHPGAYAYPGYYCPVPAPPPVVYAPPPPPPPPAVIYAPPPPAVVYTPPPPPPPPALEVVVPIHIK